MMMMWMMMMMMMMMKCIDPKACCDIRLSNVGLH